MGDEKAKLLQGTLDVLILKGLQAGPHHGYALSRWIRETTSGVFDIEDGALYTALHRMEKRKWLSSKWGFSESKRRVKTYSLTAEGLKQLELSAGIWNEYAGAVEKVLQS